MRGARQAAFSGLIRIVSVVFVLCGIRGNIKADANLAASTTYSYTVAAFDSAGNVSAQSTAAVGTTSPSNTQPLSAPPNLAGTSTLPTQVDLSWSASTDNVGVAGYHVLRNGNQVGTTSATSYVDTGLTASTTYTYTITAFDAAGNVSASSNPVAVTTGAAQSGYRLAISSNGRYLVNSVTNQPVFLTGEDGFLAGLQIDANDLSTYLNDRASRGFNAIWVGATDQLDQNNAPHNFFGNLPFDGAWFTSPDTTYWGHLDSVVSQAQSLGITVFLQPSFVGNNDGDVYDTPSYLSSSTATLQAYGTFIGNRYKGYSNIVYVLGGDYNPTSSTGATIKPLLEALGAAIAAADPNHLITIEGCQHCGYPLSTSPYTSTTLPSWLKLNWIDTTQANAATSCQAAFASGLFLPPVEGEDWYELENGITGFQARQEGYWEVLSGCYVGRMFGNGPIWSFNATHSGDTSASWQSQLGSPGSLGQEYMGRLMRSREHWLMAPDTAHSVLTAGYGSGSTLSVVARSSDGQTIIAYLSDGNATAKTINMSAITSASSSAKAWWYNPQTAAATLIGTFPNSGTQSFTAPDGNDWVLVIDDSSANLPAPGSADLTQNSGPQVTGLACSPTSVMSGSSSTCQVVLNQSAPSGGAAVTLANSNSNALSVPASVMVASGKSTSTFAATAATVSTPQTTTVTAALNGGSSSVTLSVKAPMLVTSLACSPTTVNSGGTSSCTVAFNQPSPSGGTTVSLTNSNPAALAVPASVTVASGVSTTAFTASAAVVSASQSATVTATVGTSSQSIVLTILFGTLPAPSITSLSPTTGAVGTAVTITGTNFGSSGTVTLNGTAATTTSWSATRIATAVPSGATTGNVVVTAGGVASNGVAFTVTGSTPSITSLNPKSGTVGKAVTITGTNFGSSGTVKFNGTTATTSSWNSTTIVTSVPTGATTGNVVVTVGGVASNGVSFTITSICGETGQSGTDWQNGDWGFGTPCVTGTDANGYTPASFEYWVGSPTSASFDLGIYADNSGSPGSLLCHTGTTTLTPVAGWNNLSLSGKGCPTLTASTRYWMGYITGSNTIQQGIVSGTCPGTALVSVYTNSMQGSAVLSNPFGATARTPSCYSMYLVLNNK